MRKKRKYRETVQGYHGYRHRQSHNGLFLRKLCVQCGFKGGNQHTDAVFAGLYEIALCQKSNVTAVHLAEGMLRGNLQVL